MIRKVQCTNRAIYRHSFAREGRRNYYEMVRCPIQELRRALRRGTKQEACEVPRAPWKQRVQDNRGRWMWDGQTSRTHFLKKPSWLRNRSLRSNADQGKTENNSHWCSTGPR